MGFVYNNVWEAFCKTYLELNGYFVLTNTFVALNNPVFMQNRDNRIEADLIAYKIPGTQMDYRLDQRNPDENRNQAEFFAGDPENNPLVYCEIKGNLTGDQGKIAQLLPRNPEQRNHNTQQKIDIITARFGNTQPQTIIMGHFISERNKTRIQRLNWRFKEFPAILQFLQERFEINAEKQSAFYNDPWLEMMRFINALRINQTP